MLVEALVGGVVLGFCVSYALVRRAARIPVKSPFVAGMALSLVALAAATLVVDVPAKLLTPVSDPVRYLLIAALFNVVRFLALGATVGGLYGRSARALTSARPSPELQG
jgi:heme A synthase